MPSVAGTISQRTKIVFPVITVLVVGLLAPKATPLIGCLMFGNLLRECGVLERLALAAQNELANIVTILLGITVGGRVSQTRDHIGVYTGNSSFQSGYCGRCSARQANVCSITPKNQSYDWRLRYFSFPHVVPCGAEVRAGSRSLQSSIDARCWSQCCWTNRLSGSWWSDDYAGADVRLT